MPDRKTTALTLPSGATAEIKEYISAGEFLDATEVKDGAELSKSDLAKKILGLAIASVNGSNEDVLETLRSLPLKDYLFLSKEVAKLTNADFTEAKSL
jgi:hypothetical protein